MPEKEFVMVAFITADAERRSGYFVLSELSFIVEEKHERSMIKLKDGSVLIVEGGVEDLLKAIIQCQP